MLTGLIVMWANNKTGVAEAFQIEGLAGEQMRDKCVLTEAAGQESWNFKTVAALLLTSWKLSAALRMSSIAEQSAFKRNAESVKAL